MVFFSAFMIWAFSVRDYKIEGVKTGIGRPLLDSINYGTSTRSALSRTRANNVRTADFAVEIVGSLKFFVDFVLRKPYTRGPRVTVTEFDGKTRTRMNLGEAFGVSMPQYRTYAPSESTSDVPPRVSYDENIRLAPYSYVSPTQHLRPSDEGVPGTSMSPSSSRGSLDAYQEPKASNGMARQYDPR